MLHTIVWLSNTHASVLARRMAECFAEVSAVASTEVRRRLVATYEHTIRKSVVRLAVALVWTSPVQSCDVVTEPRPSLTTHQPVRGLFTLTLIVQT